MQTEMREKIKEERSKLMAKALARAAASRCLIDELT